MLCLPWAGCELVREMESGMREAQLRDLAASTRALAKVLKEDLPPVSSSPLSVYTSFARLAPVIDGYDEEWRALPEQDFANTDNATNQAPALRVQSQFLPPYLYVLLKVSDTHIRYHNPSVSLIPNGDRIVLTMGDAKRPRRYVLYTSAPGRVRVAVEHEGNYLSTNSIVGQWQDSRDGYQVELKIPMTLSGDNFAVSVVDDSDSLVLRQHEVVPPLVRYRPELERVLQAFSSPGTRYELRDAGGWLIATAGSISNTDTPSTFWLLRVLYRQMLYTPGRIAMENAADYPELQQALAGEPAQGWYRANGEHRSRSVGPQTLLVAAQPTGVDNAAVLAIRSTESYLTLTDQAVVRALSRATAAVVLVIAVLVIYAGWLSFRIRRLSQAANASVNSEGRLHNQFKRSRAPDELGELSRRYGQLVDQVSEHQEYLRTLNSKLSHELRTPLAIIRSSLEHLESASDEEAATYQQRAKDGLDRLAMLLKRMSEASHLQQSISSNPRTKVVLNEVLAEVTEAYRGVYSNHVLVLQLPAEPIAVTVSAELLVQMLDKLLDNATSFAPHGSTVEIALNTQDERPVLAVVNKGPLLPENLHGQLFDAMTSVREDRSANGHLGLGLHVVQLICDYHSASVTARNTFASDGVEVEVVFKQEE